VANSSQAKKRARQNNTRRLHNTSLRSQVRTSRKKFQAALATGDVELANNAFKQCVATLDKYSRSGILHKNTAARYKSRAAASLKAISATKTTTKKTAKKSGK